MISLTALLAAVILAGGPGPTSAPAGAQAGQATSAPTASPKPSDVKPEDKIVCRRDESTGSLIAPKVCKPLSVWNRRSGPATEDAVRAYQNGGGGCTDSRTC